MDLASVCCAAALLALGQHTTMHVCEQAAWKTVAVHAFPLLVYCLPMISSMDACTVLIQNNSLTYQYDLPPFC